MYYYEINGNLGTDVNYEIFSSVISEVWNFFVEAFSNNIMGSIELFIDNATKGCGYTPITIPVFQKYLIIKLHANPAYSRSAVAFEFSHELMHYVYYVKCGLDKELADENEESVCVAVSLIIINWFYPDELEPYIACIKSHPREEYHRGVEVAKSIGYDIKQIKI